MSTTTLARKPRRIPVTPRKAPNLASLETMIGESITFDCTDRTGVIWGLADAPRTVWVIEDGAEIGAPLVAVHIDQRGNASSRGASAPDRGAIVRRERRIIDAGTVIVAAHDRTMTDWRGKAFTHRVVGAHLDDCSTLQDAAYKERRDAWRFLADQYGHGEAEGRKPVDYCPDCMPLITAAPVEAVTPVDAEPEPESESVRPAVGDIVSTRFTKEANERHIVHSLAAGWSVYFQCGTLTGAEFTAPDDVTMPTCAGCAAAIKAATGDQGTPVALPADIPTNCFAYRHALTWADWRDGAEEYAAWCVAQYGPNVERATAANSHPVDYQWWVQNGRPSAPSVDIKADHRDALAEDARRAECRAEETRLSAYHAEDAARQAYVTSLDATARADLLRRIDAANDQGFAIGSASQYDDPKRWDRWIGQVAHQLGILTVGGDPMAPTVTDMHATPAVAEPVTERTIIGTARRARFHDARRHFESGGIVCVSDRRSAVGGRRSWARSPADTRQRATKPRRPSSPQTSRNPPHRGESRGAPT